MPAAGSPASFNAGEPRHPAHNEVFWSERPHHVLEGGMARNTSAMMAKEPLGSAKSAQRIRGPCVSLLRSCLPSTVQAHTTHAPRPFIEGEAYVCWVALRVKAGCRPSIST